jgi:hypothetical protein
MISKYVLAPLLVFAVFGTIQMWHDIYEAMWDTKASTVVFVGIMLTCQIADWCILWLEYKNKS